jgi:NAD(P)-dependent dehydrogenase (short-subunit alcohol dehydrogenase family)
VENCVLVTGAGSGIGTEIAKLYSSKGFEVWLLGRNPKKLETVSQCLEGKSQIFPCDLNDLDQIEKISRNILSSQKGKTLKCLIHNAGLIKRVPFVDSTRSEWQESFNVHLLGPVILTQALLPLMYPAAPAYIVNVSSNLAINPIENTSSYSALKSALLNWTKSLALELASKNIHVNAVAPGIVETPLHGKWSPEDKKYMDKLQPLGRVGTPEEIAQSVYFLGSEGASWTTGSILTVDGGISLI